MMKNICIEVQKKGGTIIPENVQAMPHRLNLGEGFGQGVFSNIAAIIPNKRWSPGSKTKGDRTGPHKVKGW